MTLDIQEPHLDQLWEVLGAFHVELARREGTAPPKGSPWAVQVSWGQQDGQGGQ